MSSRAIATVSSALLGACGVILLFASDDILPSLLQVPVSAAWLGQLLGAAWLGLAALNWFTRGLTIGGIYGRPVVVANLTLYFISATTLLKAAARAPERLVVATALVACLFAALYAWLLFRAPSPPT